MTVLSVLLVCAAVFRLTRLVGVDEWPFGAVRSKLSAIVDAAHDDETAGRDATRSQRAAAWAYEMVTCPACCSMWVAAPAAIVWQAATDVDDPVFWAGAVWLTASAFTIAASYVVALLAGLADTHGE